jgi:hypothetical protein
MLQIPRRWESRQSVPADQRRRCEIPEDPRPRRGRGSGAHGVWRRFRLGGNPSPNPCNVGTHTKEYSGAINAATTAGAANQAKLVTNIGTVSCDSTTTVTPESSTGSPTITGTASVSFGSEATPCTFSAGGTCKVTMSAASYTAHLEGTISGNTNEFSVTVTNPSATVVCGGFINCKFGKAEVTLKGTNGEPTSVSATEVELNREGGFFCPSSSKWTGKYDVTSPSGGVTVH